MFDTSCILQLASMVYNLHAPHEGPRGTVAGKVIEAVWDGSPWRRTQPLENGQRFYKLNSFCDRTSSFNSNFCIYVIRFLRTWGASSSSSSSSSLSRSPSGPLRRSWRSHIRYLHGVDCTRALASSWTLLSQTLRGRPDGLLQLAIGFLPSYLSTMRRRTSCACTRRATWPEISVDDVMSPTNQIAEGGGGNCSKTVDEACCNPSWRCRLHAGCALP